MKMMNETAEMRAAWRLVCVVNGSSQGSSRVTAT
jgi:hypothetical protein